MDLYSLYDWVESGLYLFEIRDKTDPSIASIAPAGSLVVESRSEDNLWPTGFRNRAIIHNDTVFYVRDESLWAAFWGDSGTGNGPF